MKPGPMGPGGQMTSTSTCEWFAGAFSLVCRSEGKGPTGEMHGLEILGYSTERKRYTYYGVDNSGMGGDLSYGDLTGDTWTWEGESLMGGKPVKGHYTIKQVSPDAIPGSGRCRWALDADGRGHGHARQVGPRSRGRGGTRQVHRRVGSGQERPLLATFPIGPTRSRHPVES